MVEKAGNLSHPYSAYKLVEAIKRLLINTGIPLRLMDYGVKRGDLIKFVKGGMNQVSFSVPNPRNLEEANSKRIYGIAF